MGFRPVFFPGGGVLIGNIGNIGYIGDKPMFPGVFAFF